MDPAYFLDTHARIYDATSREWVPFALWDAQLPVLDLIDARRLVVILKARQLGQTWLALGYILWLMLFWPSCTALVFSRREEDAIYLLGEERLRGMYRRLPEWLRRTCPLAEPDGATARALKNGSIVRAFPSNAGDSYTATIALVDEADLVPDLDTLLGKVKPTIDAGGKLILLSRADKSQPNSTFKRIYREAKAGHTDWHSAFLPWDAHPGRDALWYETQKADVLARTGSLDDLHEQYPTTDAEALSPRTLDKRIAPAWLESCFQERLPLADDDLPPDAPALTGLVVFVPPCRGRVYVVGADPAEGNPTSDDSALCVLDAQSGEEVASLAGKLQPAAFAEAIDAVGTWYNRAAVMVERNNHGHAVLLWLREHSGLVILPGHDGNDGWLSSVRGKALLYSAAADAFRHGEARIHSLTTFTQLASIEGNTLRAPAGEHDDRADAFALALAVLAYGRGEDEGE
jgi:Terminase RNaseH-like domain